MKSYFRFLLRNKLYTAIEVVGMAVAIAFVVFIGSFVIGDTVQTWKLKNRAMSMLLIRKASCLDALR